jgi:hypothetical protein
MPLHKLTVSPSKLHFPSMGRARRWWLRLTPQRQDRIAMLAPLAAVMLFFAAIVAALGYLRLEEIDREQEAVQRDVEYTQQRLRLRLLERQEQLMRVARDLSNHEMDVGEFKSRTESMINQYPELQGVAWVDERRRVKASMGATVTTGSQLPATHSGFTQAREGNQAPTWTTMPRCCK